MLTYRPWLSSLEKPSTQIQQSDALVIHSNDSLHFKNEFTMNVVVHLFIELWIIYSNTSFTTFLFFSLTAEKFLESVEGNQNYPLLLLTLLEKSQDNVIRVCAAVTFKNYIKRNWRIVSLAE